MRLLITFGYVKVLFPKDCDYSRIIDACGNALMVDESGSYSERVYKPSPNSEIEVKLLNDSDVRLPDTDKPEVIEKLLKVAAERDTLQSKVYQLEARIKKLTEAVASESV